MTNWKKLYQEAAVLAREERGLKHLRSWLGRFPERERRLVATVAVLARWNEAYRRRVTRWPRQDLCVGCIGQLEEFWSCKNCPIQACEKDWRDSDTRDGFFHKNLHLLYRDMVNEAKKIKVPLKDLPRRLAPMQDPKKVKKS